MYGFSVYFESALFHLIENGKIIIKGGKVGT